MIRPSLGGATLAYNAISQDYCIIETLNCLYDLCDQVVVACGGDDGTVDIIRQWCEAHGTSGKSIKMIVFTEEQWKSIEGPTKISHFSNLAIDKLTTDYFIYCQADEVIHEASFANIYKALEHGAPGYAFNRYNLWQDPLHMLNVPQERKPVSTEVIRLARLGHYAYSDGEHLAVNGVEVFQSLDAIEMFHMGFVRDKKKHLTKIRHVLTEVFRMEMDKRAEDCEEFKPERWFGPEDLIPIPRKLPKYVIEWACERYPNLREQIMQ